MDDDPSKDEKVIAMKAQLNRQSMAEHVKWLRQKGLPVQDETIETILGTKPVTLKGGYIPSQEDDEP
jgi:hypothetical protein